MMQQDFRTLTQPPFDTLTPSQRELLQKHSQIVYLDNLQPLAKSWYGDLFIIIKGQIHQLQGDEFIANLNVGDWFLTQIVDENDNNVAEFQFITQQQSLLYRLDKHSLQQVTEQNPTLKNLLFADLSARLSLHQARLAQSESQQLLHQPVISLNQHIKKPNFVDDNVTLWQAVVAMTEANAKHILVKSQVRISDSEKDNLLAQGVEKSAIPEFTDRIGMFTQADVCQAVIDKVDFQQVLVKKYTNFRLRTIFSQQDVSEALLLMLDQRIHRLPVVNAQGEIIGVLGQTELLSYLTNHSNLIVARIEQAHTLDDVSQAVEMIGKFIRGQQQNGVKTQVISRIVQSLNAHVFAKVWQILVPILTFHNTCLFVMGSEGRGEQIMRTDQDNGLIIRNGFKDDNLPIYAEQFNQALAEMGYPLCDGGIMITNERWRKTLTSFEKQINEWYASGKSEDMIWLATLIDAHYVCGNRQLFDSLIKHCQIAYQNYAIPNFINRFAKPVLQFDNDGNWWQRLTGGQDSNIDLKKAGIFPIVHGVRTLCLEHGISATNTKLRLQHLAERKYLSEKMAQNLSEALDFFLSKRLEVALNTEDKSARKVNPNTLSALEKDLLKECLAIVKTFKQYLEHHYRLDIF